MRRSAVSYFALAGACWSAAVGCGGSDRVELFPVSGLVTYQGRPAAGARLVFHDDRPSAEIQRLPIPRATVDAQGAFHVGSYGDSDGAPAGAYHITVELPDREIANDADPESAGSPADQLKGRYLDPQSTPLTCEVNPGDNALPPLMLK